MRWVIFYGNGNTAYSRDYAPLDVAGTNVQMIIGTHANGEPYKLHGNDYYIFRRYENGWGEWYGIPDLASFVTQCEAHIHEFERVVKGLTIPNYTVPANPPVPGFNVLMKRANIIYEQWRDEWREGNGS